LTLRKRLINLEKAIQPGRAVVEIQTFDEKDLEGALSICQRFNAKWPAAVQFANPDSEDIEEMAKCWCDNLISVLSLAVVRSELGDDSIKEWLHGKGIEL
jgi:hypothetical protein